MSPRAITQIPAARRGSARARLLGYSLRVPLLRALSETGAPLQQGLSLSFPYPGAATRRECNKVADSGLPAQPRALPCPEFSARSQLKSSGWDDLLLAAQ